SGPEGVVNPDFGPTDWNLLLPGITLYTEDQVIADPDRSNAHSFTVTMEVVPGTELEYELQAAAEGWSPLFPVGEDGRVTVLSTSGCDVDTEPVTEDPTPVDFSNSPLIGVAKEFTSLAAVDGQPGTFDIVFDFVLRNYGSVPLSGIEL